MITANNSQQFFYGLISSDEENHNERDSFLSELPYLSVLAAFFLITYSMSGKLGVFDWPGVENAPVLMRLLDPSALANDVYTLSNLDSPRRIFGYLAKGVARVSGSNWYGTLLILKIFIVVSLPCALYMLFLSLIRSHVPRFRLDTARIVLLLLIPFAVAPNNPFSHLGHWPALQLQTTPYAFSLFFCCLGGIFFHKRRKGRALTYLSFTIAALIHPVMALLFWIFFLSVSHKVIRERWSLALGLTIFAFLGPALFIQSFFHSESTLTAREFVEIYSLWKHPFHYRVSQFFQDGAWRFGALAVFFLASIHLAKLAQLPRLLAWARVAVVLLALSVATQFFFTEIFPSRMIAAMGPSRYLIFSYWYVCLFTALFISSKVTVAVPQILKPLILISTILALAFFPFSRKVSQPLDREESELVEWAKANTEPSQLFASKDRWISAKIRLFAGRSLLVDEAFPFRESSFRAHRENYKFVQSYETLPLSTALEFAERRGLSFLVVKLPSPSETQGLWSLPVAFENQRYRVYALF
jgi:hypothetical protein